MQDDEFEELTKAEHAHAEKQVQVAAYHTEQVHPRDLGLLVDAYVREGVVVDLDLDGVVGQLLREVGLIGVARDQNGVARQRRVDVEIRGRILVEGERVRERALIALERTLGPTVGLNEAVLCEIVGEEVVGQLARLAEAVGVFVEDDGEVRYCAIEERVYVVLSAVDEAERARVGLGGVDDLVKKARVLEWLGQLVALEYCALAPRRFVLSEEGASDRRGHAQAGRDAKERRERDQVAIVGRVVDHEPEAALRTLARHGVRHAGVQLERKLAGEAFEAHSLQRNGLVLSVEARVEAIAVLESGMVDVLEVAGVARKALKCAADEHVVQVAHGPDLLAGEIGAGLVPHAHLKSGHFRVGLNVVGQAGQVGEVPNIHLGEQVDRVVGRERIEIAQSDGGEDRLGLVQIADAGGHLEVKIVYEGERDEEGARARRRDENTQPEYFQHSVLRADNVR